MNTPDTKIQIEKLKVLFAKAPMKRTFNMSLEYDDKGCAIFTMPFDEKFNHSLGGIHGGVIATLLDNAGWFTAATKYGFWIATVDLHVQMLKPVSGTTLRAKGELVKFGKQIAFTKMQAFDQDNQIIAVASATFLVTSQSVD